MEIGYSILQLITNFACQIIDNLLLSHERNSTRCLLGNERDKVLIHLPLLFNSGLRLLYTLLHSLVKQSSHHICGLTFLKRMIINDLDLFVHESLRHYINFIFLKQMLNFLLYLLKDQRLLHNQISLLLLLLGYSFQLFLLKLLIFLLFPHKLFYFLAFCIIN